MTDDEWRDIEDEITALWCRSDRDRQQRDFILAVWRRKFRHLPFPVWWNTLKTLQDTTDHLPGIKTLRAALKAALTGYRTAQRRVRDTPRLPADADPNRPLTVAEWRERAELLEQAAAHSKHNARYLRELAEFYATNAARVAMGTAPLWPPPPASMAYAGALRGAFVPLRDRRATPRIQNAKAESDES